MAQQPVPMISPVSGPSFAVISRTSSKEIIASTHHHPGSHHRNQQIVSHSQHIQMNTHHHHHISSAAHPHPPSATSSHHIYTSHSHHHGPHNSIINRTSSSSTSIHRSPHSYHPQSASYSASNLTKNTSAHSRTTTSSSSSISEQPQPSMNHLALSVTPTSVSSNTSTLGSTPNSSSDSTSCSLSPLTDIRHHHNESRQHRSNSTPAHLLRKTLVNRYEPSNYHLYKSHHGHNGNHSHSNSNLRSKRVSTHSPRSQIEIESNEQLLNNKYKSSIISRTILQLTELGIDASTIRWPNITMQSHEYIAILVKNKLKIIDTMNKKILSSKHCNASSAMMNPQNNNNIHDLQLLAMRDNNIIKVINLNHYQQQQALNENMIIEHAVKDDHILFWRWLDSEIIAFITTKCVYHWIPTLSHSKSKCILTLESQSNDNIHSDDIMSKKKQKKSSFIQYINYDQSKDGNYLFVQGLTQSKVCSNQDGINNNNNSPSSQNGVDGVLTLYDINNNIIQPRMNAFGACFASLDAVQNVTLFCFTKKEYKSNKQNESITKLYIVELYKTNNRNKKHLKDEEDEKMSSCGHKYQIRVERKVQFYHTNDFVVSMVQCKSVLYAVTKLGCLLIFDILCGMCLYNQKVSRDVIFLVTPFPKANGIVALDRTGKLTLYYLNKSGFNNISHLLPNKSVSVLSYNVYNNSFTIKYKQTHYESSLYLPSDNNNLNERITQKGGGGGGDSSSSDSDSDSLLSIGHVKLVLVKALKFEHIGYIAIRKYNIDGSTVYLENNCLLCEDLRFIKIEISDEIIDKQFGKILNFYHINYGVSIEIIQEILSDNLFNYDCNELKLYTMNFLLNKNEKLSTNIKTLEKKINYLNGERLPNLSNDELLELERNVNSSYLKIRNYIRGKFNCIVCYEKEKHILFKPCHHCVVCANCSDKLDKCPVCNTNITEKIKVYQ